MKGDKINHARHSHLGEQGRRGCINIKSFPFPISYPRPWPSTSRWRKERGALSLPLGKPGSLQDQGHIVPLSLVPLWWLSSFFLFLDFFFRCGPFLKSLLNLLHYCFRFMFWVSGHVASGILVSQPAIEPVSPAFAVWSLNHWTAWKFPITIIVNSKQEFLFLK